MKSVARLLIIVALCPCMLFAQGRRGGARGGGRGRGGATAMDEQTVLDLVSALLNLTDAQRQQVQTVFDAGAQMAAPIAVQMQASKDAIFDAVKSGKSDAEIKNLVGQQSSLRSQILMLQAQTFSKMWAILTSDQKSEVDSFMYDDIGEFLSNTDETSPPAPVPGPPGPVPGPPAPGSAPESTHP